MMSVYHKQALGLLNMLDVFDEKIVPDKLGGGVVCREAYNRFVLTNKSGDVEFIATSSVLGAAASASRRQMIEYLTARGEGRIKQLTQTCAYCGKAFVPNHPNKRYCSHNHKYEAQKARMRKASATS